MKMLPSKILPFVIPLLLLFCRGTVSAQPPAIYYLRGAKGTELLAARELQRYLYVRTGRMPLLHPLEANHNCPAHGILVSRTDSFQEEEYQLVSVTDDRLLILGGSGTAVLYGTYQFLESTGIGFRLDKDIIPDEKTNTILLGGFHGPRYRPAFALRGIQPFHDFPEGPDWWNEDDYKAVIVQLAKLRMNFIGLHTYPEKGPQAEPVVWIGDKDGFNSDGTVKAAYPNGHFSTGDTGWGYIPVKTSSYSFGAASLFERDVFGADYTKNNSTWPHRDEENRQHFNLLGGWLNRAFNLAHELGIRTCIGTETPLTVPRQLQASLRAEGKDPASDSVRSAVYEGIFSRINITHPLDYYWLWTPEDWTWKGEKQGAVEATEKDLLLAVQAAKKLNCTFTLATCGWVLGPSRDRTEFDRLLPKAMPFAVINREVGFAPVEPSFRNISGRPTWQISWLEDDPGLTTPQLWAGRVLKDAADAYTYHCSGMMGIHWRTEILSPAIAALSQAGWEADKYDTALTTDGRDYPVAGLYQAWARTEFGTAAGDLAAGLFNGLDGVREWRSNENHMNAKLPRTSDWMDGPGGIKSNAEPWEQVQKKYAFVEAFENLRPLIRGAGNKERYSYWLNTFYYSRAQGRLSCLLGTIDTLSKQLLLVTDRPMRIRMGNDMAKARSQAIGAWGQMMNYLLQTVNSTGAMGTITNLEGHNLGLLKVLTRHDSLLNTILDKPQPPLNFPRKYQGKPRLVVTTRRTLLCAGESLELRLRLLSREGAAMATIHWKPMGAGKFRSKPVPHLARGVYFAQLSAAEFRHKSFEYYIELRAGSGRLRYPVGQQNQTVVVW
ncbi:MAG TPA: hypothetical protein VK563_10595 [Puia sp.]|nr:hypothetical protein [Puia sp.]